MRLLPFACAFLISGAVSTSAAWSVTAPQDLPAGPGRETTIRLCKSCHPLDKVVGVRRSNKEWIAVVEKMVTQGAEGTTDELNESIDYLTDQYGKPVNVNAATAAELVDALGIDPADAARASLRLSMTRTKPGGQVSIATR